MLKLFAVMLLSWTILAQAGPVDQLLGTDQRPVGVVFEVVQGQGDALDWAIPLIAEQVGRLRDRFPGLPVAVVSHGYEQFALHRQAAASRAGLHRQVQNLVNDDVPLHVCGTHASWYDVTGEDFPDYVDVAPSGPAQIDAYRELGYVLVVVTRD
jgi:intracellular sulfur oxidation DsrE/DsrF family protein